MSNRTTGFYVYVYSDTHGPFYVGKGCGNRAYSHLWPSNLDKPFYLYFKLKSLLTKGEPIDVEIVADQLSEQEAFLWEKYFIAAFGRRDLGQGRLCNLECGGRGRQKEKTVVQTEKTKQRRADTHRGMKRSETACDNLRQSMQPYMKPVEAINSRGEVVATFQSMSAAERQGFNRAHIASVIAGRLRRHRGLQWRYKLTTSPCLLQTV